MNDWTAEILRRISAAHLQPSSEARIVEELGQHLDDRYRDLRLGGKSHEEAVRAVFLELGDDEFLARELKLASLEPAAEPIVPGKPVRGFLSALWQDVRYAARLLLKDRAFTVVALLTLAIGIGANTTVFSIVNGVLLRPLPFKDQERLVILGREDDRGGRKIFGPQHLPFVQQSVHSYEAVAVHMSRMLISKTEEPSVSVSKVSADFLRVFGVRPKLGRDFSAEDSMPGATPVALISYPYWRDRFAFDRNVIGKTLSLPEGVPLTIIGVLPPDLRDPYGSEDVDPVWVTPTFNADENIHYGFQMYGKLKPGVNLAQARSELAALGNRALPTNGPANESVKVQSLLDSYVKNSRTTILSFAGAVLSILFIVIVNLTGLELARLPRWENELAVRTALGASRWRLMQLMLVKTMIVGITGGTLGLAAASVFEQTLVGAMAGIPRKDSIRIDGTVLVVSIVLSAVASLLIAIIPALRASRPNVRDMMHASAPSYTPGRKARFFQDALTATETALALILLIAAGLFANNLWRLLSHDIGFNAHGITTIRVSLPASYDVPRQQAFFLEALERLKSLSNVDSASLSLFAPINGGSYTNVTAVGDGPNAQKVSINNQDASAEYFSTLSIPIVAGRTFSDKEIRGAEPVTIISTTLAAKLWPGRSPLGRQLQQGRDVFTVVGVAGDAQYGFYMNALDWMTERGQPFASLTSEGMTAYFPITLGLKTSYGFNPRSATLLLRTAARPADLMAVVSGMEPKAKQKAALIDEFISKETAQQRFQTTVLVGFSVVALLLATIGIYSVIAYSVVRRTKEIGIRIALGAKASEVFTQLCREAILPGVIGMIAGFAGSVALGRILASYLYSIRPYDAPTYVFVAIVMSFVVVVACAIPARRAARLDPVQALRCE